MRLVLFLLSIFALNIRFSAQRSCQTLNEVEMTLYDKNNIQFKKNVTGCIQRIDFGNITVVRAYATKQKVEYLGRDTVRNMKYLTTISFVNSETEGISPVAFRNVPSLSLIQVSQGKLRQISKDIFTSQLVPALNNLVLDDNEINYIEDQSFLNLTLLTKIDMHVNRLEFWRKEWFVNTTSLETINFQHNRIKAIPFRAFVELPRLREIYFDGNEIENIHKDAFKGIRSLEYLGLGHNKLTVLEASSFPNTLRVIKMTIHANYLNFLSNNVLQKLTAVNLIMDYNPWNCECLDRISYWLYIKNSKYISLPVCKRSDVPICTVSKNVSQTCSDDVDNELTRDYISFLNNLSTPLDPICAKLQQPI